jgi:hypothetical protein
VFQRIGRVADPVQRLDRIGKAYVEYALRNPMHYRFMFMAVRPPVRPEDQPHLQHGDPSEDAYAFLRQTCAEAITAGRFRPDCDDPDEVAQMLWAGMHGIVSLHIAKAHDEWIAWRDIERTAARIRETLMRGLLRATD